MFKHIFIAFCLTVYCSLTFSSTLVLVSSDKAVLKGVYHHDASLSEWSRIVFPQAHNPNGGGMPIVSNLPDFPFDEPSFKGIQVLKSVSHHHHVNYIKKTEYLVLKITPEDMIYPYHTFW